MSIPTGKSSAMIVGLTAVCGVAHANIGLEFRPSTQTVAIGQTVNIDVYAVSDTVAPQAFSSGDMLVVWDAAKVNPVSFTNATSGYSWGNSGFLYPTLNGNLGDGDAEFSFERQLFGANPLATQPGLKVTTIRFTAEAVTTGTLVSMPLLLSGRRTRIFDPLIPNTSILSTVSPAATVVVTLPETHITGTLYLQDTTFGGGFTRNIVGTVKQGTSTVGSIAVNSIGTSSVSFSGTVSGAYTGPATIEWDGSSFLRRNSAVVLNNGWMNIGTVNMQNGDVDHDGEVDAVDIDQVIADFGSLANIDSDCDVSGEVDAADIDIVILNFGGIDD